MKKVKRVLVAFDQLGNALAGGYPDNTISARVGYFANYGSPKFKWYWKYLESMIDTSFEPIDGKRHCLQAYFNDVGEEYEPRGWFGVHIVLQIIIIAFCIPIATLNYLLKLFKLIQPKEYDPLENMNKQLEGTIRKLKGVRKQFLESRESDEKMIAKLNEVIQHSETLKSSIA